MPKVERVTLYEDTSRGLKIEGERTIPTTAPRPSAGEWSFGCHGICVNNVISPQIPVGWSYSHYGYTVDQFFTHNKLIPTGDFNSHYKRSADIYAAILTYLDAHPITSSEDYINRAFDAAIDYYKGYSMVVFAPVMNYARLSRGMKDKETPTDGGYATWALIKRIAERKVGHLCGSPVTVNKAHNGRAGNSGLSYVQGFVWIPDGSQSIIMDTTFSRMLDKNHKLITEKDEAEKRNGKVGSLFQNIKAILEKED